MNHPIKSKINAAAVFMAALTVALLLFDASAEMTAAVLTFAGLTIPPLIVVFRSWFTGGKDA